MKIKPVIAILLLFALFISLTVPGYSTASRQPVRARNGMVASTHEIASRVGAEILQRGGNAVDAAIAVGLALAVTYPAAGNLGGGGFMVIRMNDGRSVAIDYRETAPAAASRNMYLDKEGKLIPKSSTIGYLAAGVPGTVAGFEMALEKFGTMKWSELVEPAYRLAADGFTISHRSALSLKEDKELPNFPETRRIFLRDGNYYQEGDTFKQPELAETLKRLKEQGAREFYEGRTAQLIADDMRAHGGLITLEDLKSYRPVARPLLRGNYRGYEILTMPPPSSGGVALLEMLNMLEHYDLAALGHNSSQKYHVMIEVMRRAFADRAEFLGDPDFVRVPVAGLTAKTYAKDLLKTINLDKATPSTQVGAGKPVAYESNSTTHYTVVDKWGNAVSNTYTLNDAYGSRATVKGAGFLLNNEMDDFAAKPGEPNIYGLIQGEANAVAPRKRPLSSMTPTIVLKDSQLYFVVGSPGGPTIINTVLQVIVNIIDHKMNIQQAIDAPRIHHQWLPDLVRTEPYGLSRDTQEALKAKGHQFDKEVNMGDAEGVMIEEKTGVRLGASDPRSWDGRPVGH